MAESLTSRVSRLENQVKIARMAASIVGFCLLAFGGVTWYAIPSRARAAVDDETSRAARDAVVSSAREAEEAANQAQRDASEVSALRDSVGMGVFDSQTYTVRITSSGDAKTRSIPIADKDVCVLSEVRTYG